ncbi:MAG: Gfo/Idh/MocA family oxidoreductase [Terrimicrobiaceae bacterium]
MEPPLKIAVIGAGFWSQFQIPAWLELSNVECVAVCDINADKAKALAERFGVPRHFHDPEELLRVVRPDLLDVITSPETHRDMVALAARHRIPVICQKPLANDLETAREMVKICREANVPLFVHENWRWQRPLREVKSALDSGVIGKPFRARVDFSSSFPVFDNQPFLRELEQFILSDMGVHILDVIRFLFGEADWLIAHVQRINPSIKGEDVATVLLRMRNDITVISSFSYASRLERERFPEAFIVVEGDRGSIELAPDFWIRVTDAEGTKSRRCPPRMYSWADPSYLLIHSSIVDCHQNSIDGLLGKGKAETTGEDNLRSLELVFGAYESARLGQPFKVKA